MNKTKFVFGAFVLVSFIFSFNCLADHVRYLGKGTQALAAFARLIEESEHQLDLATYIFEPCDASVQVLMNKIVARARAGVRVRVLLDAFEQSDAQKQTLAHFFARHKIPLRFFNYSLQDFDLRMHNKIMIADRRAFIAGGRNLSDAYFGLSATYNYVDRDLFVEGFAATSAQRAFDELWQSANVVTAVPDAANEQTWRQFCGSNFAPHQREVATYLRQQSDAILADAPLRTCARVEFFVDHADYADAQYGVGWKQGKTDGQYLTLARLKRKVATQTVLDFIRQARTSLNFENYAYLPIYDLESAFTDARQAGVRVHGLSNMDIEPQGNDTYSQAQEYAEATLAARDSTRATKIELISSRGTLGDRFTLTPPQSSFYIHAKSMYRDGVDALVGSFNLDSRSSNINLEAVTRVLDCPELVADLEARHIELAQQLAVDLHRDPPITPPEISWLAKIFATMAITEF